MQIRKLIRALSLTLCAALVLPVCCAAANAAETIDSGVRVRDPFVLAHNGTYYLYGTGLKWDGYGCVHSDDLTNWSEPVRVYTPQGACDGEGDWWAPECHVYNGRFYLFATYRSAVTGKRGVAIFRADDPLGPFEIITDGHVTPKERDAIDGTLYVDESGQPWMIYVGEWTSNEDEIGEMMAAKLSDDLTSFVSEPIRLFRATDGRLRSGSITDGPFLYRTKNGRLLMLWSNADQGGYCVRVAFSSNGRVDGKWRQQPGDLFKKAKSRPDGGHGMLFTAPDGTLMLSIHSPNNASENEPTTAVFLPVDDVGDTLLLHEDNTFLTRACYRIYYTWMKLLELFR